METQKWISVKDRLPELAKDVLLYKKAYGGFEWFNIGYLNSFTTREHRIDAEWVVNGNYGDFEASHWIPLPESPKN